METSSPNLSAPPDVSRYIAGLVRKLNVSRFVDAGCGDGQVLLAAASSRHACSCIGLEVNPGTAARTAASAKALGLRNVRVVVGDLFVSLTRQRPELVFAYLGAAHHQRLGALLNGIRRPTLLVTALYPAVGLPEIYCASDLSLPLYFYLARESRQIVKWDSPISISIARDGGAQLTSVAAMVFCKSRNLSAEFLGLRRADRRWIHLFLGKKSCCPGEALMIDILIDPAPTQSSKRPVVATLALRNGCSLLTPYHVLVLGSTRRNPIDAKGPWREVSEFDTYNLLRTNPARLIRLIAQLPDSAPAVSGRGRCADI